jgi:hypothetical protein
MKWTETELYYCLNAGPIEDAATLNMYTNSAYGATPGRPVYRINIFPDCKLTRGEKSLKKKPHLDGFHPLERAKELAETEVKRILTRALVED